MFCGSTLIRAYTDKMDQIISVISANAIGCISCEYMNITQTGLDKSATVFRFPEKKGSENCLVSSHLDKNPCVL